MTRYLLWLIGVIALIILMFVLISPKHTNNLTGNDLVGYANTNATTRLTIDAPEGGDQTHQAVEISINRNNVTLTQLSGYNNRVVSVQTFASSQAAYNVFLHAIARVGFTSGNTNPNDDDDLGYCPFGDRYIFELINNNQDMIRFWSTTCGGLGTYGGNLDSTVTLFENQVPNYPALVQNITF